MTHESTSTKASMQLPSIWDTPFICCKGILHISVYACTLSQFVSLLDSFIKKQGQICLSHLSYSHHSKQCSIWKPVYSWSLFSVYSDWSTHIWKLEKTPHMVKFWHLLLYMISKMLNDTQQSLLTNRKVRLGIICLSGLSD